MSDFEEMLMWTSYRYCIGRHTYVISMASEIGQHYYNKLSNDRKEFSSMDIRREIMEHLRFLPFSLYIHRLLNSDDYDPISVLFNFFEKEHISSIEDLAKYGRIEYDSHKDEYTYSKCEPVFNSYISISDIEDLLPWDSLASLFNVKKHKMLELIDGSKVEGYQVWKRNLRQDGDVYYSEPFGWHKIWKSVDDAIAGNANRYIPDTAIKQILDM